MRGGVLLRSSRTDLMLRSLMAGKTCVPEVSTISTVWM